MMRRLVAIAVLVGCGVDESAAPSFEGTSRVEVHELGPWGPPQLDLLFVIDSTTTMAQFQDRMAMLPSLIEQAYRSIGGGVVDMHIGVTTDGELRRFSSIGGPYITIRTELDLARITNFTGTLVEAAGHLTNVGAASTAPNRPLEALRRVLAENPDGLIRLNAPLGVVIISASDDTSAGVVGEIVQFVKSTKSDPANVYLVGVTQIPTPRLDEFFAAFPNRNFVVPIADGDLAAALGFLERAMKMILPAFCWNASDVDALTPGPQYDCTVTTMIRGEPNVLPPCKVEGDQFCWSLFNASQFCSDNDFTPLEPSLPPYNLRFFRPAFRMECVVLE